jgi:Flp pilus assembly protein TadG
VHLIRGLKPIGEESGQVAILFALLVPFFLLFVGFGIDFGFAFLTKAQLAKATDAASLAVMRNLGRGETVATAIGQSEFALNVNASSTSLRYVSAPSASISYSSAGGEPIVTVAATAAIRTFFIGIAGFPTLAIADSSQATRPPVILSLVLDKSGSMNLNGGSTALPPSVTDFLGYFIENTDQLGEISFSTIATQNVAMSQTFQTAIENSVNGMAFGGATFAQGGLLDAQAQLAGVSSPAPNAVKVVVFFTDGWANTNQDTLGGSLVNYGGCAPAEFDVGWCNGISCMNPTTGNVISGTVVSSTNAVAKCNGVSTFTAQDTADLTNPAQLTIQNIATEADYRAVQLANTMRAAGITVYSIGLGDKINTTYLQELANDPASPVYNASMPTGLAEFAPTASQLDTAFQTVASKILLRLTQ